jgi:hypothetical protein
VHGIDISSAMVTRLKEQAGGADILATVGDFATTTVDQTFTLVFLVRNTITNVTTQDEQVATFRNAAVHLKSGGRGSQSSVRGLQHYGLLEATDRLASGETDRAHVAPEFGYFDDAQFTPDFEAVVSRSPAAFVAESATARAPVWPVRNTAAPHQLVGKPNQAVLERDRESRTAAAISVRPSLR